jgi:TolA-binding protein
MTTHLVKRQKITKRRMKEDPLVTAAGRAMDQWEHHGSRILIVAGVIAVVGLLIFFMTQARSKAEVKASGDLYRATLIVNQGDFASATPMLREIIDNQPGTNAAREAMLYLGDCYMAQSKASEATPLYRKFIEKSGQDRGRQKVGYYALGTALEDSKEFRQAADAYADAAKRSGTPNERGRAMLAQARCLLRAGQSAKAAETYKAIVALAGVEESIVNAANAGLGETQAASQAP